MSIRRRSFSSYSAEASLTHCLRARAVAPRRATALNMAFEDAELATVVVVGACTCVALGTVRLPYVAASDCWRLANTAATAVFREAAVRPLADDRASAAWAAATCAVKVIAILARREAMLAMELTEQPVL